VIADVAKTTISFNLANSDKKFLTFVEPSSSTKDFTNAEESK